MWEIRYDDESTSQAAQSRCTVVRPMRKSIGKWEIRPPSSKIVTPKNFILKLCTRDYVGEVTRHANFGFNWYSGSISPNRRNITTLWLFSTVLPCPYLFFLDPMLRSNRWTDFHALWLRRRVSAQGWSILGLERRVTYLRKICPQNSPKWAWIGNFQLKRQNITRRSVIAEKSRCRVRYSFRQK